MPSRQSTLPNLNLVSSNFEDCSKKNTSGLLTPRSAKSSPSSPFQNGATIRSVTQPTDSVPVPPKTANAAISIEKGGPISPGFTAIPQYTSQFKDTSKHNRDPSRSFFANFASKSSTRINSLESSGQLKDNKPKSRGSSNDRTPSSSRGNSATPDLPVSTGREEQGSGEDSTGTKAEPRSNDGHPDPDPEPVHVLTLKRSKPRFTNLLARTRSIRVDDGSVNRTLTSRRPSNAGLLSIEDHGKQKLSEPLKTAPLPENPAFKDAAGSTTRNHSTDRCLANEHTAAKKERSYGTSMVTSASLSHVSGASAALFNNLKQSSTGAADRIGRAGKGFLGKITRSGSSHERELFTDDSYVCAVINLPLIEQTRRTRISKRLEDCKDKTEYWMPALPYRCIDYLNLKGCEEEGLYRVPGSGKEVKHWQRRFDTELDINLFDEPDLYDINTIGSMFKAWLRELPDELFPKETQAMIATQCEGATTAPQMLRDELSKLPPYNYYLLFAITCHLNLLHSYLDQNKMDYRNLCICFQPSMKIDGFCFHFLVCDWKNCWQGCWTEKEYLRSEKEAERPDSVKENSQQALPTSSHGSISDERAISSSGSSQPAAQSECTSNSSGSPKSRRQEQKFESNHKRSYSQLPELGPPLSPIKI